MGTVVQLINPGHTTDNTSVKRWAGFGQSIRLRKGLILRFFREVIDGDDVILATILKDENNKAHFQCEAHLYPGRAYDLTKLAGLCIIVRAMELGANNTRASRLLVEFVAMTDATRLAMKKQCHSVHP